jgi:hypothetical protein
MSTNPFPYSAARRANEACCRAGEQQSTWVARQFGAALRGEPLVTGLAVLSTVLVIAPLVAILVYLIYMGASSLNLAFFTQDSGAGGRVRAAAWRTRL